MAQLGEGDSLNKLLTVDALDPNGLLNHLLQNSSKEVMMQCSEQNLAFICQLFNEPFDASNVEACVDVLFRKGVCKEGSYPHASKAEELESTISAQRNLAEIQGMFLSVENCSIVEFQKESQIKEDTSAFISGFDDFIQSSVSAANAGVAISVRPSIWLCKKRNDSLARQLCARLKMSQEAIIRMHKLQQEVDLMKQQLANTQEELAAVKSRFESELNITKSELNTTKSELNITKSELNTTKSEVQKLHQGVSKIQRIVTDLISN
nr:unnamed protein product [Naegleria fowleri]